MDQLQIASTKKTKTGTSIVFKKATADQLKDIPAAIKKLRAEKKQFKVVENAVEKTFKFNGNNYIVTSKILQ